MKACFVNLPWEEGNRRGIRAGCRFPNLTVKNTNAYVPFPYLLAHAASYVESLGSEVLCIDGVAERASTGDVRARVIAFSPALLVCETSTTSLAYDLAELSRIKAALPSVTIGVYGSHVHVRPEDALACAAVDAVLLGEPELTSADLVRAISRGEALTTVPGLMLRGPEGRPSPTEPRRDLVDLDALPYPMRRGLPMSSYNVPGFPSPVVFMYGSRGCPYPCTFCLWPQTNLKGAYRARAPEKIVEEMAHVLAEHPETRSFFFDDDTFNIGRTRLVAFADEMDRRRMRIPWGMNARADHWDRELLRRLVATGLFTLRIGIESGDQGVLDRTRKGIDLDAAREMLAMSHELGIKNHVSFIIGLPGETEETVDNTIRWINSVPVDSVQFSVAIPFPGTPFYREMEDQGMLVTRDWTKYNGFDHVVMRTKRLSADGIGAALTRARRRVYFQPRFIARRLSYVRDLRDLGAVTRKVLRLIVARSGGAS
jgi:anaerobic magnesium-protoporphyrin IX monomethyl ester cyclase